MGAIARKKEKRSSLVHRLRSVVTIRGVLAVELLSSLQAQHAATKNIISVLDSKVISLETHQISSSTWSTSATSRTQTHPSLSYKFRPTGKLNRKAIIIYTEKHQNANDLCFHAKTIETNWTQPLQSSSWD